MRQSFGPTDFFALEAADCLDRLERLLSRPEGVPGDEFVRQVRLLRGAALMAHQQPIAQAGAAFEGLARAVRDGHRPWDAITRETALGAVDDFRGLVRQAPTWGRDDDRRAARIAAQLAEMAGTSPAAPARPHDASAGVRDFVAREGARLADTLGEAARDLMTAPAPRDLLERVLASLQPMRGLAGLGDLGALPDLLDGVELTITELRQVPASAAGAALLAAAESAMREASRGRADGAPVRTFAARLLAHLGDDADIVPIESLFVDGDAAPYVTVGGGTRPGARTLGAVELVSQGEHFLQVADRLAGARDEAERDLRLAGLLGTLHSLQAAAAAMPGVAGFAREALRRIADGHVTREAAAFVGHLRRAADLLRRTGEAPETVPASAWRSLFADGADVVPIETLLVDDESDVVPIESLLLQDEPAIVPIESLAPDHAHGDGRSAFETSVGAYMARLRTESAEVVPIDDLVYRGQVARSRARELHEEVGRRLRAGDDWHDLRPLIEEILDLVPLALDHG